MPQEKAYIVFQAYGNEHILQECLFALLTFSKYHKPEDLANVEICIYTDQEEWFRKYNSSLPLTFRKISMEQVKAWRGEIDFVHRVKIEVLRDLAKTVSGAVFYVDTDVCFLQPVTHILQNILQGSLYMHIQESIVKEDRNPIFAKLHKFLRQNNPVLVNGKRLDISTDSVMWNAGVLGFHTQYAYLLDEVLQFTDDVYKQFGKHVVEQFAFSYYFQQTGFIHSAAKAVFHYWHFKELRPYLTSFFNHFKNASWDDLVKYTELIQWHAPMQDKCSFYQNRNCINKLRRVHWIPTMPDWDLLLKQMS